jgi:hypothetical protein
VLVLRVLTVLLIGVVIVIAAIPALVLIDLVGGGDGWGLCPNGLENCESSYFDGPELVALLAVALFVLVALLRLITQLRRLIERRRARRAVDDEAATAPVPRQ